MNDNDPSRPIHLADDLYLPANAAIARYVILGKSGAGKTNADCVLIEEFVRIGVPTVVLSPLANMWGLRSSADGESSGLPIAIIGGKHGDVPLPSDRAIYVADMLSEGISAVLDLSLMDQDEYVEFAKAFVARYARRMGGRGNAHIVFEEGDKFCPNTVGYKNPIIHVVRTMRNDGIGYTFSTQRGQKLHKDVIDSASVFIAMRMTGELAQEAVGGEIGSRIGKKTAAAMMADLQTFARGEAWFIPESDFLGDGEPELEPKRIRFRLRHTFDVRPPKVGQIVQEPKVLAEVDLEQLRAALSDDRDDDAGDDDEALRARIADLESEIVKLRNLTTVDPTVLADRDAARVQRDQLAGVVESLASVLRLINSTSKAALDGLALEAERISDAPRTEPDSTPTRRPARSQPDSGIKPAGKIDTGKTDTPVNDTDLSGGALKVVRTLAMLRGRAQRVELGIAAGYSPKAGGFRNLLSELRGAGFIVDDGPQHVALTAMGAAIAGDYADMRVINREIHDMWRAKLDGGPRKLLDVLIDAYPSHLNRETLADRAGYVASAGGFRNNLSALRTTELIREIGKDIWATSALFPAGKSR